MLYILHGEDDFSLTEALAQIKEELGDKEMLATNTTVLQAQQLTLEKLTTVCDTLPFLALKRLVIVEGLLSRFEPQRGQGTPLRLEAEWRPLTKYVAQMPQSTVLVLIDSRLGKNNPLLRELASQAVVRGFPLLRRDALHDWIRSRASKAGCSMSPPALNLLADLVGGNLWLLSSEIDKLCLYAHGRRVEESDVNALVAQAQEANVFAMVDAILDRRLATVTRLLHRLRDEGAAPPYLLVMITRQFRLVIQAKDLLRQRRSATEIAHSLSLTSDYLLRKTMGQARKHSRERLEKIYGKLLETDISIKTGRLKGELALDLLVSELCGEPSD